MHRLRFRLGIALVLCALCAAIAASAAAAAEFPYTVEPELSLTGDCSTSAVDPVPDPDCEPTYPAPPAGPSGRFFEPWSVAIDAYGNEYVASFGGNSGANGRIDIFDENGRFISEMPDTHRPQSVAVDSKGFLYAYEQVEGGNGEVVRYTPTVYKPEEGEITYSGSRVVIDTDIGGLGAVAVDPTNDHLYASWWGTYVTEYESAVDGNDLLETIEPPGLFANQRIAIDGQRRRLYLSSCTNAIFDCIVMVVEADAPYAVLEEIDGSEVPLHEFLSANGRIGVAVDEETGHSFIADLAATKFIYEFDENYKYLSKMEAPAVQDNQLQIAVSNSPLNPDARNHRYLFVPLTASSGSVLAFEPPEIRAPEVKGFTATNIGETEAELKVSIDPGVDPEAEPAEYVIEYVTQAQFEANGYTEAQIATSGTIPSSASPRQISVFIQGLSPKTQYRARAFAKNGAGNEEEEVVFATFADAPTGGGCSNEALRTGASALLPDCRAYELVTPPDTNGNPTKGAYIEGDRFGVPQSDPSGGVVSFQLLGGALPGTEATGGVYGDPYKATRGPSGWSTAHVGPTGAQTSKPRPGSFSPDQGFNFWLAGGEGSATVGGKEAHYIRYPDGHSELIGRGTQGTDPSVEGRLITEDATHVVFQAGAVQLEPNAPPNGTRTVYDRTRDPITGVEETHVASLLPGNVTPAAGHNADYLNASADGNGIAFEVDGTLYLRVGNAVTYQIGTGVDFAGVSEHSKRIFYVESGDLFAYDVASEEPIEFSDGVGDAIAVNVSPDGSRAYFVSEEAIVGSGPNPNGAEPQTGQQNLYLSQEGAIDFVGTVTDRDVEGKPSASGQLDGLGVWSNAISNRRPAFSPSRVTADGSILLFQSRANLDGYEPGEDPQVYRYDSAADRLACVSCPPTKSAPIEGAALQSFVLFDGAAPFGAYGFVPGLAANGNRAFFESTEALVSGDTDGQRDVYEWEEASVGSCTKAGGCIYLISSGHSETDDFLFGHSESGDDAFFTTTDILVAGDQTTLSIYDARVGGGFAKSESIPCPQVDLCRPPATPPPATPPPTSESLGRLQEAPKPFTCPKGKRKVKRHGKFVCIKKKKPAKHKKKTKAGKSKKGGQR